MNSHVENASPEEQAAVLGYSAVYTGNLAKKTTGKPFKKVGYENESFFRKIFVEVSVQKKKGKIAERSTNTMCFFFVLRELR